MPSGSRLAMSPPLVSPRSKAGPACQKNVEVPQLEAAMKLVADMFAENRGADENAMDLMMAPAGRHEKRSPSSDASGERHEGLMCKTVEHPPPSWLRSEAEQLRWKHGPADFSLAVSTGETSPAPGSADLVQAVPSIGRTTSTASTSGTPEQAAAVRNSAALPQRRDPWLAGEPQAVVTLQVPQQPQQQPVRPCPASLDQPAMAGPAAAWGEATPCRQSLLSTTWTPKWSPPPRSPRSRCPSEQRSSGSAVVTAAPQRRESGSPRPRSRLRADSPSAMEHAREEHAEAVVAEFEAVLGRLFPSVAAVQQAPQHSVCEGRSTGARPTSPGRPLIRLTPPIQTPSRSGSAQKPRQNSPRHPSPRQGSPDRRTHARTGTWPSDRGAPWQHLSTTITQSEGPCEDSAVGETFRAFCGAHRSLDGRSFAKLCRDCHLIDRKFTATDADLIFARVVPSGLRRVDLFQFEMALRHVAEKKGLEHGEVLRQVAMVKAPTLQATKAEPVRFHDDRSTYTGTHVYGGPDPAPKGTGHMPPQPQLTFPSDPPKSWVPAAKSSPRIGLHSDTPPPASPRLLASACTTLTADGDNVEATFRAFCGMRQDLDGRSWTKLCRDCHLIDKRLTAIDADLIFAKVVPSGQRRIDLWRFEAALRLVAEKKAVDELVVRRAVAGSTGPTLNATKTEAVRFHDDKSTYTGTHLHGGPEVGAKGLGTAALGSA